MNSGGFARGPALDNSRVYMGNLMSFLLRGDDTGGRFSITEGLGTRGNEPPPHVHDRENEIYYILEGAAEFWVEEQPGSFVAGVGEVVFLPRGKAHALAFRSDVFRTLLMAQAVGELPVGMDSYFHALSRPAPSMRLPDGLETYATGEVTLALATARRRGIDFLSPGEARKRLPSYPGFSAGG